MFLSGLVLSYKENNIKRAHKRPFYIKDYSTSVNLSEGTPHIGQVSGGSLPVWV